jgi:exopolysaccharide production protein ExoZ
MRNKIVSIQFLRFVAAALVVLFHTTVALEIYFAGSLPRAVVSNAVFGASGIHIFFVISGFIMVYTSFNSASDQFDARKFAFRRFIRIYPIYIIYSLVYIYFYHAIAAGKNLSIGQFFGSLLLLPGYSSLIIGPAWTLSYEVYFYICFGIAMTCGLTRGLLVLTVFYTAAMGASLIFDTSNQFVHLFTSSLLIEFLLGAWVGYATVCGVRVENRAANAMLALSVIGFLAGVIFGLGRLPSALTWGMPSAFLVAGLVSRENNASVPLVIKKLSFLGDSSYSLYLLHVMLIDAAIFLAVAICDPTTVRALLLEPLGAIAICATIAAYCILVALGAYEFLERKILWHLHNLYRRNFKVVPGRQRAG